MSKRIAIFLPSLSGGGAEKVMLALAESFISHNLDCDIVIAISEGEFIDSIPYGVRLVKLNKRKTTAAIFALARYLRRERPAVLLSTVFTANVTALLAGIISFSGIRLVTCEASPTDWDVLASSWWRTLSNKLVTRILYRHADATIAVSNGVRDSLLRDRLVTPSRIHVIPNPVPAMVPPAVRVRNSTIPTVLSCGRLEPQKDHATLLRAFGLLRKRMDARLLVLGAGSLRESLEELARNLGVASDVFFAGFDPSPYVYMRDAAVFVHTARYEGFGVVLLEALACGCPVIATDCPGGIRDVLANGRYGALIPVGDDAALAEAMESVLTGKLTFPDPKEHLKKFELGTIADAYITLLLPRQPELTGLHQ
jgi:glycosyltransferase involved in cell wall biosynthesis